MSYLRLVQDTFILQCDLLWISFCSNFWVLWALHTWTYPHTKWTNKKGQTDKQNTLFLMRSLWKLHRFVDIKYQFRILFVSVLIEQNKSGAHEILSVCSWQCYEYQAFSNLLLTPIRKKLVASTALMPLLQCWAYLTMPFAIVAHRVHTWGSLFIYFFSVWTFWYESKLKRKKFSLHANFNFTCPVAKMCDIFCNDNLVSSTWKQSKQWKFLHCFEGL